MRNHYFFRNQHSVKQFILYPIFAHVMSFVLFVLVSWLTLVSGRSLDLSILYGGTFAIPPFIVTITFLHRESLRQLFSGTWPMFTYQDYVDRLKLHIRNLERFRIQNLEMEKECNSMYIDVLQIVKIAESRRMVDVAQSARETLKSIKNTQEKIKQSQLEGHQLITSIKIDLKKAESSRKNAQLDIHQVESDLIIYSKAVDATYALLDVLNVCITRDS